MTYAIGIDLGGTHIKAVSVTPAGHVLEKRQVDTAEFAGGWPERIRGLVDELQSPRGGPAKWVGLGAPGIAAQDGRSIRYLAHRLDGMQGLDWVEALGTGRRRVRVLNDAHAALLGEAWLGAAIGCRDVVLLTLGTGVGGAMLVDGKLLRGHIGRAGHLGHLCLDPEGALDNFGTPGSLQQAIGECTLRERSNGRFSATGDLIEAYRRNEPDAARVWLKSVRALAGAIASLINAFDPEMVIVGGGIAAAEDALFAPLHQRLDQIEWRPAGHRVKVVPAKLGAHAGALGAARWALERLDSTAKPRRDRPPSINPKEAGVSSV
ncbi:MAG: ROK family protein [Opitutaceae bacterium]|nr:ROK family protein [Opitutaceae bacterium]